VTAEWFEDVVVAGLQKLYVLRLPGTPPEDAIKGTGAAWLEALWNNGYHWDEALDRPRMERTFSTLLRTCDRWPSPRMYLDHLGARPQRPQLPPPRLSPEQRQRNKARLQELLNTLNVSSDTGTPS